MRLPIRPHTGPARGHLEWHRPSPTTLHNLWHHPISAGASRWGHRLSDPRTQQPGRPQTGRTLIPAASCEVRIKDRFPASISWERLAWMHQRLADNRSSAAA
jgi:hypothetical protein